MLHVLLCVILFGAFFGFAFSGKGEELEGAVEGAKKAGRFGCLSVAGLYIIGLIVGIIILLSS